MLKKKIAVFDLDDTLYNGNSHFAILNQFYRTKLFTSILARGIRKLFPTLYLKIAYYYYDKIPNNYKCSFKLPYRNEVLNLFKAKKEDGYHVIVISNAPIELLKTAAKDLQVDWLRAGIGKKSNCLVEQFDFQELFVCTDNITDLDLLNIADEAVITCKVSKRKFFINHVKCKKYKFIEDVCDNEV